MEVREANTGNDLIELLSMAQHNEETEMFDNFEQHAHWITTAFYNKGYQILVVDDGNGLVGYLVWQLYQINYKYESLLHHMYVIEGFRKQGVGALLIEQFIHNIYNSTAQRFQFNTKVLPEEWLEDVSLNIPWTSKYRTYYAERTPEIKEWYNENIRKNSN